MSFAAEVRAEMGRQGLKPADIAEKTGLGDYALTRKITQEIRPLNLDEACALADALGVPAWELMRRASLDIFTEREAA